MVVTIEELQETLGRIERDLAEARSAMAELSWVQDKDAEAWWKARLQQVQERNSQLQPTLNQACEELNSATVAVRAEDVQQMMLAEGISPEANWGSSGILEMREE